MLQEEYVTEKILVIVLILFCEFHSFSVVQYS
jgi:hypothetical protein